MEQYLSLQSSIDDKRKASEVVYENLIDYFFDKIVFVSLIFSRALNTDGTPVVSTTNFIGTSRITDTAEGKYMNTGKSSRMRCSFYLTNPDKLIGYILSPAVYDSFGSLNSFSSMDVLRSYVGIKFTNGAISVAVKEVGNQEKLISTGLSLIGSGASSTYSLEIRHNVNTSEIYINGILIGSYASDMVGNFNTIKTFLPLLSPAKSTDGSAVGIVIENYQYIQSK